MAHPQKSTKKMWRLFPNRRNNLRRNDRSRPAVEPLEGRLMMDGAFGVEFSGYGPPGPAIAVPNAAYYADNAGGRGLPNPEGPGIEQSQLLADDAHEGYDKEDEEAFEQWSRSIEKQEHRESGPEHFEAGEPFRLNPGVAMQANHDGSVDIWRAAPPLRSANEDGADQHDLESTENSLENSQISLHDLGPEFGIAGDESPHPPVIESVVDDLQPIHAPAQDPHGPNNDSNRSPDNNSARGGVHPKNDDVRLDGTFGGDKENLDEAQSISPGADVFPDRRYVRVGIVNPPALPNVGDPTRFDEIPVTPIEIGDNPPMAAAGGAVTDTIAHGRTTRHFTRHSDGRQSIKEVLVNGDGGSETWTWTDNPDFSVTTTHTNSAGETVSLTARPDGRMVKTDSGGNQETVTVTTDANGRVTISRTDKNGRPIPITYTNSKGQTVFVRILPEGFTFVCKTNEAGERLDTSPGDDRVPLSWVDEWLDDSMPNHPSIHVGGGKTVIRHDYGTVTQEATKERSGTTATTTTRLTDHPILGQASHTQHPDGSTTTRVAVRPVDGEDAPDGKTIRGTIVTETDAQGNQKTTRTTTIYDGESRSFTTEQLDSNGNIIESRTESNGTTTETTRQADGTVKTVRNDNGTRSETTYGADGRAVEVSRGDGSKTRVTYGEDGPTIITTNKDGSNIKSLPSDFGGRWVSESLNGKMTRWAEYSNDGSFVTGEPANQGDPFAEEHGTDVWEQWNNVPDRESILVPPPTHDGGRNPDAAPHDAGTSASSNADDLLALGNVATVRPAPATVTVVETDNPAQSSPLLVQRGAGSRQDVRLSSRSAGTTRRVASNAVVGDRAVRPGSQRAAAAHLNSPANAHGASELSMWDRALLQVVTENGRPAVFRW